MATSTKQKAAIAAVVLALLLMGGVAGAAVTDKDDDKPDKGKDCPPNYHWHPGHKQCVRVTCPPEMRGPDGLCRPDPVIPGGGKVDPQTDQCPPGMIKNAARLKALSKGLSGKALDDELAKYPECVPIQCPAGTKRNAYGECIPQCPEGMQWSPLQKKCLPSPVNCPPGEQWSPSLLRCIKTPPKDDPPPGNDDPKDIPSIIKVFPEGGGIYQVRYSDTWLGTTLKADHLSIGYAFLRREAFLAARQYGGLDDDTAMAWAAGVAKPVKAYTAAVNLILCSGANDACYGTWGYCGKRAHQLGRCKLPNGSFITNHPGPHGRAIQLEPEHPNNIARLLAGEAMARGVTLGSPNSAGDGSSNRVSNTFASLPAIYCPVTDRKLLWDSKGKSIEPTPETWSDGTTKGWPPPIVTDRTIADYANTGRKAWGCLSIGMEVE